MPILEFQLRELKNKREWLGDSGIEKKSNGISLEVERLKRSSPELFDPSLYHNSMPWSFEEYRKRRLLIAQADAVLAVAVGSNLGFEGRMRFIARMYDFELIDNRPTKKLKIVV